MKSHSEMLSLGVAKIKQVYSKVVKKRYEAPWFVVSLRLSPLWHLLIFYILIDPISMILVLCSKRRIVSALSTLSPGRSSLNREQSEVDAYSCSVPLHQRLTKQSFFRGWRAVCTHTQLPPTRPAWKGWEQGGWSLPALGTQTYLGERPPVQEWAGLLSGPGGNWASQVCKEEGGAVSKSLMNIMWHAFSAKAFKKSCSSLGDYRKIGDKYCTGLHLSWDSRWQTMTDVPNTVRDSVLSTTLWFHYHGGAKWLWCR